MAVVFGVGGCRCDSAVGPTAFDLSESIPDVAVDVPHDVAHELNHGAADVQVRDVADVPSNTPDEMRPDDGGSADADAAVPCPTCAAGETCIASTCVPDPRRTLATGEHHTCAIDDGAVHCWGRNEFGSIGDGTFVDRLSPTAVKMGSSLGAVDVSGASTHSCAVLEDSSVRCWGDNEWGQLSDQKGTNSASPVAVDLLPPATQTVAHSGSTCALTSDGHVYCWGRVGGWTGTVDHPGTFEPRPVDTWTFNDTRLIQIYGAALTTSAIVRRSGTTTKTAGYMYYCFEGTCGIISLCCERNFSSGVVWVAVRERSTHGCGLTTDGELLCRGTNDHGQLGDGTRTDRDSVVTVDGAVPVEVLVDVSDFAVGGVGLYDSAFTCAIAFGGEVFCWGSNATGVLGADLTDDAVTPQRIGTIDDAVEISCGGHCCVRRSDDSVACWGGPNAHGQIGNGTTDPVYEPVTVIPGD